MLGKLSTEKIEQLLSQQLVGRIGCHVDGTTYIVPISFAYDGAFIYCHTFEGKKMDMMRKNHLVCFEVDNTKDLANWQSVIAWGVFEELTDVHERCEAIRVLRERIVPMSSSETMQLARYWPFIAENDEPVKGLLFRIRITEKTGRFETMTEENFYAS